MPTFKEFSAWIEHSDGKKLPEYAVETKEEEVSCWIPSEAGKVCLRRRRMEHIDSRQHRSVQEFLICWKDTVSTTDTRGSVFVDGVRCRGMLSSAGSTATTISCSGIRTSSTTTRAFQFSTLELTGGRIPSAGQFLRWLNERR